MGDTFFRSDNEISGRKKSKTTVSFFSALAIWFATVLTAISALSVLSLTGVSWENWVVEKMAELMLPEAETTDGSLPEQNTDWNGWQRGICKRNGSLRTEPQPGARSISSIDMGETVTVVEQHGEWLRVRALSKLGWVEADNIAMIGKRSMSDAEQVSQTNIKSLLGTEHQKMLDSLCENYSCMGATVAVIDNGEVRYTYEYGYSHYSDKSLMNSDTKIRVASLSKVIVAMAALTMEEQGLVSLDEDISNYLGYEVRNPNYPDTPITLRMMLTHTSSMTDFGVKGTDPTWMTKKVAQNTSYMDVVPGSMAAWRYNNSVVCLMGSVLEKASGMTLVDYIDEYFFDVMGIDASFHASKVEAQDNIATLYRNWKVAFSLKEQTGRPYYENAGDNFCLYAGDLTISAKDYAQLMCVLIGDGSYNGMYYLAPESVEEMLTDNYTIDKRKQCLIIKKYDEQVEGRDLYYHTGNAYGVLSYASWEEETGDGVVVITTMSGSTKKNKDVYMPCLKMAQYCYYELLEEH